MNIHAVGFVLIAERFGMTKEIWVRLVGDAYGSPTYTKTLKEFMEQRNLKRTDIADWWKV